MSIETFAVAFVLACVLLGRTRTGRRHMRKWAALLAVTPQARLWGVEPRLALRLDRNAWNDMTYARHLGGLRRGRVRKTPVGIRIGVRLQGDMTLPHLSRNTEQIEAGLGVPSGTVRVRGVSRADKAEIHVVLRDPLKEKILWEPSPGAKLSTPLKLAVSPFGDEIKIDLRHRIGLFGTSGSGKSCAQRLMIAHVIQAVDAVGELWDLKMGLEAQHVDGKMERVESWEAASDRVDWFLDEEFPRRAAIMKEQRTSEWRATVKDPYRVVFVDEGNVCARNFEAKQLKRLFQLIEQGRALGVYFVWATQFPKATNLPTEIRSQLDVMICLQLTKPQEARVVFDTDMNEGWDPTKLKGEGWALVKSAKHNKPNEARCVWIGTGDLPDPPVPVAFPSPKSPRPASTEGLPADLLEDTGPAEPVSVQDKLRAVLDDEPRGARELAREIGHDPGAVHRALQKLVDAGVAERDAESKGYRLAS